MNPEIIYRHARLEDAEAITKAHMQAWKESYVGIIEQEYLDTIPDSDDFSRNCPQNFCS